MILSFNNFTNIDLVLKQAAEESLHIKRKDMPQIIGDHYEDFRKWLADNKIVCFEFHAVPSHYKATQNEFNKEKVKSILKSQKNLKNKEPNPIIVTQDNLILDGHHRWLANLINSDKVFKALQLPLNIGEALDFIDKYNNTQYKSVNQK